MKFQPSHAQRYLAFLRENQQKKIEKEGLSRKITENLRKITLCEMLLDEPVWQTVEIGHFFKNLFFALALRECEKQDTLLGYSVAARGEYAVCVPCLTALLSAAASRPTVREPEIEAKMEEDTVWITFRGFAMLERTDPLARKLKAARIWAEGAGLFCFSVPIQPPGDYRREPPGFEEYLNDPYSLVNLFS